jgi:hypothetical protein
VIGHHGRLAADVVAGLDLRSAPSSTGAPHTGMLSMISIATSPWWNLWESNPPRPD